MKKLHLYIVSALFLFYGCDSQPPNTNETNPLITFADSLFQKHIDDKMIAGASVLVFQNGQSLLDKSYGFASLELEAPMPVDAHFEIGSITKQFTAAAILKLEDQGKLSIEDDFTNYVEFDADGRTVTINQLLNHTSGITSYTAVEEFWTMSMLPYPKDSLVSLVERKGFQYEPGESMIYNNTGYFFLGMVIEAVSEMSYEEYLTQEIFEPLGMANTYYCSNSKVVKNKAYGYGYSGDGLQQKAYLDHRWPYAAGSLCSTTDDLLIWMRSLHSKEILGEELYESISTPGMLNNGSAIRYAMGLANFSNFGYSTIRHGGGINGFLSDSRYYPEEDLFVICLVNTTGPSGATFFSDELTWHLLDKQEYQPVELDIDLASLAGRYKGQARGRLMTLDVSSYNNSLILSEGDDPDTLSIYVGNNTWMDGDDIISFADDECRLDIVSGYYRLKRE